MTGCTVACFDQNAETDIAGTGLGIAAVRGGTHPEIGIPDTETADMEAATAAASTEERAVENRTAVDLHKHEHPQRVKSTYRGPDFYPTPKKTMVPIDCATSLRAYVTVPGAAEGPEAKNIWPARSRRCCLLAYVPEPLPARLVVLDFAAEPAPDDRLIATLAAPLASNASTLQKSINILHHCAWQI